MAMFTFLIGESAEVVVQSPDREEAVELAQAVRIGLDRAECKYTLVEEKVVREPVPTG